ncbi:hypothetical protein P153DRAFT_363982 [Dothidotthia symphoricarpi CBS 119687]|uniref:DUF7730 domain-containing protein n=1 Tax=Dothidotthia symphoricarpi CBS 119687 TaxID=1392245 RepID=A0A6A6AP29_9PLEO|nr:uncharacterized protein P153DRAFT_363982 [Dothidotthia symphoricarpi CBS 119687]KAF2132694.1 hypothetical protein P153DRAFT_363982 [Dothidotthia symphoricarpi CBS 119687]
MSPPKTADGVKTKKEKTGTKDRIMKKGGIVKTLRNARGYHKFKSGMLNVTPKGDEKELVNSNRNSPLLRLPPELRNRIWSHVLGGKIFRASYQRPGQKYKLRSPPTEPDNCMSLLQTCRQIYSEGALMPLSLNTFTIESPRCMKRLQKCLKEYQRKQIVSIQLELEVLNYSAWFDPWYFEYYKISIPVIFPGLRQLRVLVLSPSANDTSFQEAEGHVRDQLGPLIQGMPSPVNILVEQTNQDWKSYDLSWKNVPASDRTLDVVGTTHVSNSSMVLDK